MEIKPVPNPTKVATKWALINLLAQIIITYAIQLTGADINGPVKFVSYIPMIACLLLAQKEFKDELGGYVTFNQAFSAGFRYAVFGGLLIAVFIYVYSAILSPEYFAKTLEAGQAKMAEKGLTQEQIDKAMEISKKWGPIIGAFAAAIGYAVIGAVIALIGAAIFKKEKSPLQIADELDNTDTAE